MAIITDLIQLIYISKPFGYDTAMLNGILLDARRCNERDGVTGALVCRQDVYMQLLEGPAAKVEATYARIQRDDRHANAQMLVQRPVTERLFGNWAMLHDPATSMIWSQDELDDGAADRASQAEVVGLFKALAGQVNASRAGSQMHD